MRPLSSAVPALHLGALVRGDRGPRGHPPGGRAALRRQHAARPAADRPAGDRRGRARAHPVVPARRLPGARRARSPTTTASSRRTSCSARAPTTCSCSARARTQARATWSRSRTSRRTRSTASPPGSPGPDVGDDRPVLTFVCRPHNPTGAMVDIPAARPLVVDEAYFEYGGETAVPLIGDDVIVVRTFSKAFGLASARVGYALARAGDGGRAERAPAAAPDLDARRGARARGSRGRAARRLGDGRRARAARRGAPRHRPRAAAVVHELPPRAAPARAGALRGAARARGSRCGRHRARSASRCTGPTPTTGSSRRSAERCDAGQHVARRRRAGRRCRRARRARASRLHAASPPPA